MKIVFLDAKTLGDDANLSVFEKFGEFLAYDVTKEETIQRAEDADVIITNKVIIDKEVMDKCKKLKLICIAATGMNNVDLEYAAKKGIAVKNVAGYSTDSVVQHTFAMAFYLIEKLKYYDEYVKSGKWCKSEIFTHLEKPFWQISGKTWGIIGLGTIGKKVANVAKSFGCNIIYYSTTGKNQDLEYPKYELDTLLKSSDIISIHAPLNEHTFNLLNYHNMKLMKEGALLLNLGRGNIVNEDDLAAIIDEKNIIAGLDVLGSEPMKEDNPLKNIKKKENLFITPHLAWGGIESRKKLIDMIVKNIEEFSS